MRRRDFITGIAGSAAAWPLAVRAQQALPVVGILHEGLPAPLSLTTAFQQGLIEGGISQGSSIKIEDRWAEGRYNRLPALATELLNHQVNIIVAAYLVAARAVEAATQTVPTVFITGSDPITAGLVSSLNRPTGNDTGIAFMFTRLGEKNLATLHELVPNAGVIGALVNPNNPNVVPQLRDLRAAAGGLGLQIVALSAADESEIDRAFSTLTQQKIQAVLVTADGFFFGLQDKLAALAARYAVPAFYPLSDYVLAGGLISYGANLAESWRQAGAYVAKIVKGAKPADLPVMQPAKFELVLNSKTAKTLGLEIPSKVLALADKVIE
jgi:putative tryptophan/tyrosine transport system substrate-binding protein